MKNRFKAFADNMKKSKVDFILLAILSATAFLRFYHLGFQQPWLDELSTMQVSDPEVTFQEMHTLVMTREAFPHLYFICLKFLSSMFGHSIYILRLFSAIFGTASVYVIFLFLKEILNRRAGYIGAMLLAVNFFHIYHSQDARCYTLLVFFILFSAYRMVVYIKNPKILNAIAMGISCGLIPNAHPIGVLNIGVIYATLLVFFLSQKNKKPVFFQLLCSFLATLAVFFPVYQIIARVTKWTVFWIPAASIVNIKQAFFEMLGFSAIVFYVYVAAVIAFFIMFSYKTLRKKDKENRKFQTVILSFLCFWVLINIGVIIVKSYMGISIILSRYFIGSLSVFIVGLSYCLSLIRNKTIRNSAIAAFVAYSLYFIYERDYYTAISKTEWRDLANEISKKNVAKDPINSPYGYVSNILFKHTPSYELMKEIAFEDYLNSLRNGVIEKQAFWFFDGNFRPYGLAEADQKFLDDNYVMDIKIEKYDCWARHYKLRSITTRQEAGDEVFLYDFSPKFLDNEGHLLMFANGTIRSKPLKLGKGKYELILEAMSLPTKPLLNENAHITIAVNMNKIGDVVLSEKPEKKDRKLQFSVSDNNLQVISITYDNDYEVGDIDRNVVFYSIRLNKTEQ